MHAPQKYQTGGAAEQKSQVGGHIIEIRNADKIALIGEMMITGRLCKRRQQQSDHDDQNRNSRQYPDVPVHGFMRTEIFNGG